MKKIQLNIHGMHCAACEVLIERQFKHIRGVGKVRVNHATGKATLFCDQEPSLDALNNAIRNDGYSVSLRGGSGHDAPHVRTRREWAELGGVAVIAIAAFMIMRRFNIVPTDFGVSDSMTYGAVFVLGLVAAMSTCIAVTGGLLVAVASRYAEQHPEFTGVQKFKPHIYFNVGR